MKEIQAPLVSIIVPVYNAEKYLNRCILRVFNNGSFMINRKYIQLLLSPLMNVYLIRQKNSTICNTLQ